MRRGAALHAILVLWLASAGCARDAVPRVRAAPPTEAEAAALLAGGGVSALRAVYEAELVQEGERATFDAVVAARDSGELRIEVLGVFGPPELIATVSEGALAAYDAEQGVFLHGAASPDNLARVLRTPLEPAVFVRVLLGRAGAVEAAQGPERDAEGALQRVTLRDAAGRTLRVWAVPGEARPKRLRLADAEGDEVLRADFERWTEDGGPALPARLALRFPAADALLTLSLEEFERDPALEDGLFRLRRPSGARDAPLDARGPG